MRDQPLFTELIDDAMTFSLVDGATFVSSITAEARSHHVEDLQKRCSGARFVDVASANDSAFEWTDGSHNRTVRTHSTQELEAFWGDVASTRGTYLDITGFNHPVWAPLVSAALTKGLAVKVVYVEPVKYRRNSVATGTELFDLSKGFGGVSPLPGFVSLADPDEDDFYFVPLLGFEGRRFSYLMTEVAPVGGHVIPVIGVPGFQPEFVGYAYDGNQIPDTA